MVVQCDSVCPSPTASFYFRVLLFVFADLFTDAAETEKMALSLEDSEGVYFVPSFNGLQVFSYRVTALANSFSSSHTPNYTAVLLLPE